MNRKIILQIFLIFSTFSFHIKAKAQIWKPVSTAITFKIKHSLGATAEGSFKGFAGSLNFDPTNLASASIRATIEAKTLNTGINLRDNIMRSDDYFDTEKYPRILMVSSKIEKTIKENEFIGYFNLTIKNVTKTVKIPFTFTQNNSQGVFKGSFSINRTEYGVGGKSVLLGDIATIFITINTQQ